MALAKIHFFSQALGMCVTCNAILPQYKNPAQARKVPVLWLLHGANGNYTDWVRRTNVERYAAPYGLAVIMPSAHNSSYTDMAHGMKFYTYISRELPETLPKMLNLSTRREDNFIAGLSMGGAGSMAIGLSNPEKYSAIGCLSAGAVNTHGSLHEGRKFLLSYGEGEQKGTYQDPFGSAETILKKKLPCPRIYHACGDSDFLLQDAHTTRDFFTALPGNPFDYTYVEDPGAHSWDFWDAHIKEFIEFLNLPKTTGEFV
ncbi:MAG: esterase family protein [Clostridia bacterium]|nr:esterase family protein [Clostridia bacterium]